MSRKHDKSVDDEQSPNLLLTGPIAIRGLGRGVKDALVRGRPSRHRAFAGEGTEQDVDPTPLQQMLAGGPTVSEAGPSSDLVPRADAQADGAGSRPFPSDPEGTRTDGDSPQEDRVEGAAPDDADVVQPTAEAPAPGEAAIDDWVAPADEAGAHQDVPAVPSPGGEVPPAATGPVAEQPSDEFDALPVEEPEDAVALEEHDDVVRPVEAQPTAADADGEVEAEPSDPDTEQPGFPDGERSDGERSAEAQAIEARPRVDEPSDEFDALTLDERIHPAEEPEEPEEPEDPASDAERVAGALQRPEAAADGSRSEAPDGDGEDPQPGPEDRTGLLDAEQAAADVPTAEQPEAPVSDGLEGEHGKEGAVQDFTDPGFEETAPGEREDSAGSEDVPPAQQDAQVVVAETPATGQEPDDRPEVEDVSHRPLGDEQAERPAADDIVLVAASDPSATTGTAGEGGLGDEVVDLPEAETQPDEPGAATLDERREVPDPESEQGSEPEAAAEPQGATPDDAPQEQERPDAPSEGRQWVTAEELFGLPLQSRRQDPADEDALQPTEGSPVGEEHRQETDEPGGEEPAELGPEHEEVAPVAAGPEQRGPEHEQPQNPTEPESERQDPAAAAAAAAATAAAAAGAAATASAVPAATPREPRQQRTSTLFRPSERRLPLRERFGREAIGIAVLVVLALICAGLITAVVIKTRHDAAIAASEAGHYTPPPLVTPQPTKTGPAVAVIGDGSTSGAASGVSSTQRWTSVLASSLGGTVSTDASSGMGYAAKSTSGETFVQAAGKVPADARVVVFFGGAADTTIAPLSLAKAATSAFAAAKQQAPDAKIVVVGPVVAAGAAATDLTTIRDTLRGAALVVKATWVDPIDKGWMPAAKQAGSPTDLSASDERTIASNMQAVVRKALG